MEINIASQRLGRPPTEECPKCAEEGIVPPRHRMGPGKPCTEHDRAYRREYMKSYYRRASALKKLQAVVAEAKKWVDVGQFELARADFGPEAQELYSSLEELGAKAVTVEQSNYITMDILTMTDERWEKFLQIQEKGGYKRYGRIDPLPVITGAEEPSTKQDGTKQDGTKFDPLKAS